MKKRNIFGIILMLCGVGIIIAALYMNSQGTIENNKKIQAFEKELEERVEISGSNTDDDKVVMGTVGIMEIPKIGLKVAIGEGVDDETLKYAVGHFPDTAMAGEKGNFAVAGHRSYTYNEFFNRLDELVNDDEIIVTTLKGKFKYKVNDITIVEPNQVEVLNSTESETITLITCTPVRTATHRLIIKGVLEK